jgi:glutaredoxin-like protein NrdH
VTVDVYGKPGCVQCLYTNRLLQDKGHEVRYHDITTDDVARQVVEGSGYTQLPFVVADVNDQDKMWHGFSPDKIKSLSA